MHTKVMALNMRNIGHLIRCEIRSSERESKCFNIVTIAQDGQGGEHYKLTDENGRVCEFAGLDYTKQVAREIGFSPEAITVI